jgi:molecular chaperone GrpE
MTPEGDPARKGMEMTLTQFETVLTSLGVTAIEALGKEFDPEIHNAVMHVEDDEVGENIIVEEFEKGFKLGDKVIRFSIVKVAN